MSLTIFSFEKHAVRASQAIPLKAHRQEGDSSVALLDGPSDEHSLGNMVLDLEHLTPETLEKFFPSESTLALAQR